MARFPLLLESVAGASHRLAWGLLHDRMLAEDAFQEAAVKAWRHLDEHREGTFRPWFLTIVANQCRDFQRGRWWRVFRSPEPVGNDIAGPEDDLDKLALRVAVAQLPYQERAVLILYAYLDLPWTEVATVCGLSEAGARSRFYRAIARLRPQLAPEEGTR